MGLKVISIGSSSSGNSYIVTSGSTHIILDAGISGKRTRAALAGAAIAPEDVDAICITHEHDDHVKSLHVIAGICENAAVIMSCGTAGAYKNIDRIPGERLIGIRAASECDDSGERLIQIRAASECDDSGERLIQIRAGRLRIGDISVTAFNLSHDAAEPIGYTFENGGRRLTVVTDTGIVTDEIFEEIKKADMLVFEANHEPAMVDVCMRPYSVKQRILGDFGHLSNEAAGTALAAALRHRRSRLEKANQQSSEDRQHTENERSSEHRQCSENQQSFEQAHNAAMNCEDAIDRNALKILLAHLSSDNNAPYLATQAIETILSSEGISDDEYMLAVAGKNLPTGPFEV